MTDTEITFRGTIREQPSQSRAAKTASETVPASCSTGGSSRAKQRGRGRQQEQQNQWQQKQRHLSPGARDLSIRGKALPGSS